MLCRPIFNDCNKPCITYSAEKDNAEILVSNIELCCAKVLEGGDPIKGLRYITLQMFRLALSKIPDYEKAKNKRYTIENVCFYAYDSIKIALHNMLYISASLMLHDMGELYSLTYKCVSEVNFNSVGVYLSIDPKSLYATYCYAYFSMLRMSSGKKVLELGLKRKDSTYTDIKQVIDEYLQLN